MCTQGIDGISWSSGRSFFEAKKTGHHRLLFLDECGVLVPEKDRHQVPVILVMVAPPRQDPDHVFLAVKIFPGVFVSLSPFLGSHSGMLDGGVKRISLV